jgi:predicted amino acid dehydrogenase
VLKAIEEADVVIFAEELPQPALSLEALKVGALACDASCSKIIADKLFTRPDVTLVEGDWIKIPHPLKFGPQLGPENDIIPASLAETMLLAFEGKLTNYSLGDNVNLDKMPEIADFAVQHGFETWAPDGPVR